MLDDVVRTKGIQYQVVAVDPNESRRFKMKKIAKAIGALPESFQVADIPQAKEIVNEWTTGIGCNAILEVGCLTLKCSLSEAHYSIDSRQ